VVSAPKKPVTSVSRQIGQLLEHAHQITANQVGGQGAPGHETCAGRARVEPQAQLPAWVWRGAIRLGFTDN
jgi:hypothetical protein